MRREMKDGDDDLGGSSVLVHPPLPASSSVSFPSKYPVLPSNNMAGKRASPLPRLRARGISVEAAEGYSSAVSRTATSSTLLPLDSPASVVSMMTNFSTTRKNHRLRSKPRPVSGKDLGGLRRSATLRGTLAPISAIASRKEFNGAKNQTGLRKKTRSKRSRFRPASAPVEVSGFTQRYRKLCGLLHCNVGSTELTALPTEDFLLAVLEIMVWNRGYVLEGDRKRRWMNKVSGFSRALLEEGYWYVADLVADLREPTFKADLRRTGMTKTFLAELVGCLNEAAEALNAGPTTAASNVRPAPSVSPKVAKKAYYSNESSLSDDEYSGSDSSSNISDTISSAEAKRASTIKTSFEQSYASRPNASMQRIGALNLNDADGFSSPEGEYQSQNSITPRQTVVEGAFVSPQLSSRRRGDSHASMRYSDHDGNNEFSPKNNQQRQKRSPSLSERIAARTMKKRLSLASSPGGLPLSSPSSSVNTPNSLAGLKLDMSAVVDSDKEVRSSYSISDDDGTLRVGSLEIGVGGTEGAPGIDMIKEHVEKDAIKTRRQSANSSMGSGSLLSTTHLTSPSEKCSASSRLTRYGSSGSSSMHSDFSVAEDTMAEIVEERKKMRRRRRKGKGRMQDGIRLMGVVGKGAGGRVYKAIHVPTLRVVAVKQIKFHDGGQRRQMRRELDTLLCGLEHPNIVQYYDSYATPGQGTVSMVLEYMDAGSLQDLVDKNLRMGEMSLCGVASHCLKGLAYLQSIKKVHRDIKPSNLLLSRTGSVKIADFGIAKHMEGTAAQANTYLGTAMYMSPERAKSDSYSYNADVWALGLSLLTCALGHFPLASGSYFALAQAITEDAIPELPCEEFSTSFQELINLMLRRDPEERPKAEDLLSHIAVSSASASQTQGCDVHEYEESKEARGELARIVAIAKEFHLKSRLERLETVHEDNRLPTLSAQPRNLVNGPRRRDSDEILDVVKLSALASQLGLPAHIVVDEFHRGFGAGKK